MKISASLKLLSIIVLCLFLSATLPAQVRKRRAVQKPAADSFQRVTTKDELGLFEISAPVQLMGETTPNGVSYHGESGNLFLTVAYSQLVSPNHPDANHYRQDVALETEQSLARKKCLIKNTRRINQSSYYFEYLRPFEGYYQHVYQKSYINNGRLFYLACASDVLNSKNDLKNCQSFFDSFRIL